jgi:hypothetical protein
LPHPGKVFLSRWLQREIQGKHEFSHLPPLLADGLRDARTGGAQVSAGRGGHSTESVMNGAIADGDSFYDGEFYYDAPVGPKKGKMARMVKNTSKLNAKQLAAKLQSSCRWAACWVT